MVIYNCKRKFFGNGWNLTLFANFVEMLMGAAATGWNRRDNIRGGRGQHSGFQQHYALTLSAEFVEFIQSFKNQTSYSNSEILYMKAL